MEKIKGEILKWHKLLLDLFVFDFFISLYMHNVLSLFYSRTELHLMVHDNWKHNFLLKETQ